MLARPGTIVDRGPDHEPLVIPDAVLATIASAVVAACWERRVREGLEDPDELDGPEWQT